jgi:hypothetical protein
MEKELKKIFCFITAFMIFIVAHAQYENMQLPKFLPPPPNAFQITKSADVQVGLNSGTANISIPLFEIMAGGGKIPLTLNYSSNGVTVDEVASRTGINWTLNIGGVISRTVLDEDDEYTPLRTPPADPNNANQLAEYVYPMMPLNMTGAYNTQPDEYRFNVNGLSGKFFYTHTGALKLSGFSNVKIEKNGTNSIWKFKVTSPEGVVYYFGGPAATEKSKYENIGCGRDYFNLFSEVSYYLNKIEYTNGETVLFNYVPCNFSYVGSVVQTFIAKELPGQEGTGTIWGSIPGSSNNTCQSRINQNGVLLQSISCSNGTTVNFSYLDREDIIGEKALENIAQYYNGETVNRFKLLYEYSNSNGNYEEAYYNSPQIEFNRKRLFLKEVQNLGRQGSEFLSTKIEYNNFNDLPPRLSTAQDHFGYFNGKHNQFYVPMPGVQVNPFSMNTDAVAPGVIRNFNNAFALNIVSDKEPDVNYAVKGALQKITYATGGSTSLEWEANTVNKSIVIYPPEESNSIYVQGTCLVPYSACARTVTRFITINYPQYLNLIGTAGNNNGEDQLHSSMIVNVTNNTTGALIYNNTIKFNQSFNEWPYLPDNTTYKIELISTTNEIPSTLVYKYHPGNIVEQNTNLQVPGLRVKTISDNNGNGVVNTKRYYYYKLSDPTKSSGQGFNLHYYNRFVHEASTGGYWGPDNIPYISGSVINVYDKIQSSSAYRSYLAGNNSINYSAVVEALGNDFENGGVEHHFGASYNALGQVLYGAEINNGPFADNSYMNGLEIETKVLQKKNNTLVPVSKTINEYSADYRTFGWYNAFVVQSKNNSLLSYQYAPTSNPLNLTQFDIMMYPRYVSWVHLDKTTNYTYDESGAALKTEKIITYDNPNIASPGSETVTTSDGKIETATYKYIKDYSSMSGLSANTIAAVGLMESKNIVSPLIEKSVTKNNVPVYKKRTEYKIWNTVMGLPETLSTSFGSTGTLKPQVRFHKYDAAGNATELSKEDDIHITYLWGYNNLYPVAEATNAAKEEIFYTSFENEPAGITDNNAKTGAKVAVTNYTVIFTPPNAKQYLLTYFIWNGSAWNYMQQNYTGNSVVITGSKIDEVRIYPKDLTLMSTFTYYPLIGVSSKCDEKGNVSYYEYDAFNRLSIIRDQDKNILKKICYNYAGKPENCLTTCVNFTPSWQNTVTALRCQLNSIGQNTGYQEQEQSDVNNCSATYNQTRWVVAGLNTTSCPLPASVPMVSLTSNNNTGVTDYAASYYNTVTGITYTFTVSALTGLQPLGSIPAGTYNLTISNASGSVDGVYASGCKFQTITGVTPIVFYNIPVSDTGCKSPTFNIGQ